MKVFREDFDRERWEYSHAFSIAEFSGHRLGDTKIAGLLSAGPLRLAAGSAKGRSGSSQGRRVRVAPVDRPAAVWRRALQQPAARTGDGARRRENPRVGRGGALFSLRRPFQPLFGISCPGSGPDRETRCCGTLRASTGCARAVAGPFRGAPGACPGSLVRVPGAWRRRSAPVSVRTCRQAPGGAVNPVSPLAASCCPAGRST